MNILLNDLSFHGQLLDIDDFKDSIAKLLAVRGVAKSYGREVYCHRSVLDSQVTQTKTMRQAVGALPKDQRLSLKFWLLKHGYSWEDLRQHPADEWLEHNGAVVTDLALGEAAWRNFKQIDCRLVSVAPSDLAYTPLPVDWVHEDGNRDVIEIFNYWDPASLQEVLGRVEVALTSWGQLIELKNSRWPLLTFAKDAFKPLDGLSFYPGAAQRILFLLDTLNKLKSCYEENGNRTQAGYEIYQNHFTGTKSNGGKGADFKDSSTTEKSDFKKQLTFKHPEKPGDELFCPWHGSVQTPQLRIHFSSPINYNEKLYIVYVGDKITKS